MRFAKTVGLLVLAVGSAALTGCVSVNRLALDAVGDALSSEGSGTAFTGDNDPILVADALPFAVKMYEALTASNPTHPGLARSAAQVEVTYATAFVAGPADLWPESQFDQKQAAWARAKNLDLRGRDHALKSLDLRHPGLAKAFETNDAPAFLKFTKALTKADAGAVYWFAAGHLSALALTPLDLDLSARAALVLEAVRQAAVRNPTYGGAAFDSLLLSAYASLPAEMGGHPDQVEVLYQKIQSKTGKTSTSAELTMAAAVDLPAQRKASFVDRMNRVLAVDAQADPSTTLAVLLDQQKARWYLGRLEDLFLE